MINFSPSVHFISYQAAKLTKPKVGLTEDEIDSVINYNELMKSMKDALEHLKKEYNENVMLRLLPSELASS